MADAKRPTEDIIKDILEIKSKMSNTHSEERIDDMIIRYKSVDELEKILENLENELKDAMGMQSQKWVTGIRRGYGRGTS